MKILIDTNIVIDALTSREPWNEYAEKIFLMAANNSIDMYIMASKKILRQDIHGFIHQKILYDL